MKEAVLNVCAMAGALAKELLQDKRTDAQGGNRRELRTVSFTFNLFYQKIWTFN